MDEHELILHGDEAFTPAEWEAQQRKRQSEAARQRRRRARLRQGAEERSDD